MYLKSKCLAPALVATEPVVLKKSRMSKKFTETNWTDGRRIITNKNGSANLKTQVS